MHQNGKNAVQKVKERVHKGTREVVCTVAKLKNRKAAGAD